MFQKDVEEEYSLRPPTATKILKDMEKNGLIRRETVPYDARLKRIVVTEKGIQYQEMIRESLEETERRLTAGITEDDLATFFRVISRMIRNHVLIQISQIRLCSLSGSGRQKTYLKGESPL